MKHLAVLSLVSCFLSCASCSTMNATERVLSSSRTDEIDLLNVSFLGGMDLWISPDGEAVCRFVNWSKEQDKAQFVEERYSFRVPESDLATLVSLLKEHNFFEIKTKNTSPIPDEARPAIYVRADNTTHVVCKWAHDTDGDFDPICNYLLRIASIGRKNGTEIGRGAYDWSWEPDGFVESEFIEEIRYSGK